MLRASHCRLALALALLVAVATVCVALYRQLSSSSDDGDVAVAGPGSVDGNGSQPAGTAAAAVATEPGGAAVSAASLVAPEGEVGDLLMEIREDVFKTLEQQARSQRTEAVSRDEAVRTLVDSYYGEQFVVNIPTSLRRSICPSLASLMFKRSCSR